MHTTTFYSSSENLGFQSPVFAHQKLNIHSAIIFFPRGVVAQYSVPGKLINREKVITQCNSRYGKKGGADGKATWGPEVLGGTDPSNNRVTTNINKERDILPLVSSPNSFFSILFPPSLKTHHFLSYPLNLATTLLSTFYTNLLNPPLHPSVNPKFVLTGNFAPVDEIPPTECPDINGNLPPFLNGVYMRNGPNPQHGPVGPHHLFEGDGMLHSIRLSDGHATFCSRYVKTYKYKLEKSAGVPFFPNFLSGSYGLVDIFRIVKALGKVIVGQINLMEGFGVANTSVAFLFNKLFALVEFDLPYEIKFTQEGDIETIGRYNFHGEVFANMTAHPKIDPETGEVFAFQCFPVFPYLTFFRFEPHGLKQQDVPIYSMKTPTYIHDFAITKRYAIFPDGQLHMAPLNVAKCKGMPACMESDKLSRIGILPRYATSDLEMKWFDVPGFNALHIINAWEEGEGDDDDEDTIVIIAPNCLFIENFLHNMEKLHFSMEKLRIDTKTGKVSRTLLSEKSLELGSINSSYLAKKNRYAYMAVVGEYVPKMSGVVKIDLELGCEVGCRIYKHGCYGGETFFVAREGGDHEDDGYIVSFVHDEIRRESRFLVMDAKLPTLDIVAEVNLPGRVPYGFHGLFVSEKILQVL